MKRVLIMVLALLLVLVSCKSTETRIEYVPVTTDYTDIINPVFKLRPEFIPQDLLRPEEILTLEDVIHNSVCYQYAMENWRDYAVTLEDVLLTIANPDGS